MLKPFFSRFNQTILDSIDDLTNIKNLRPIKEFIQKELEREIKIVCEELEKIYSSPIN